MAGQYLDKSGLKKLWAKIKSLVSGKANSSDVYTKTETDSAINNIVDSRVSYYRGDAYGECYTINSPERSYSMQIGESGFTVDSGVPGDADGTISNLLKVDDTNIIYNGDSLITEKKTDTKLSTKANLSDVYTKTQIDSKLGAKANSSDIYTKTQTDSKISGKQDKLVSGTNIKTINGNSLLGSGNIPISATDSSKLPLSGGKLTGDLTIGTSHKIRFETPYYALSGIWATTIEISLGGSVNSEAYYSGTMPSNSATGDWYVFITPIKNYCNCFICGLDNGSGQKPTDGGSYRVYFRRVVSGPNITANAEVVMFKVW